MDSQRKIEKAKLLLVDDDRLVLVTLARGLTDLGYTVQPAESVDEAEAILALGDRYDMAVIDVNMPGKNGLYLAERLNNIDRIPFVFLSAYSEPAFVEQASALGGLSYVTKPVDAPKLVPVIESALAQAEQLRRLRDSEAKLQAALDNERIISAAIGIAMVHYRLSRREAFDLLRNAARKQRRKLSDVANDFIDAIETLNLQRPPPGFQPVI